MKNGKSLSIHVWLTVRNYCPLAGRLLAMFRYARTNSKRACVRTMQDLNFQGPLIHKRARPLTGNPTARNSMQVTKGTWRMREQCVPGSLSLSSSHAREPGNEAKFVALSPDPRDRRIRGTPEQREYGIPNYSLQVIFILQLGSWKKTLSSTISIGY